MNFLDFNIYAYSIILIWLIGISIGFVKKSYLLKITSAFVGLLILSSFITMYWIALERPPFRTLAETRLWYSFFLIFIGIFLYTKWKLNWILIYTTILSSIFILINILNPETFNKSLMPALQSIWFIPHVIVYMIAYAFLSASFIIALKSLYDKKNMKSSANLAENIVYIGFGFLTLGLLFGALWAKKAWGHYWTWDPKETWAFITWVTYLLYIHITIKVSSQRKSHIILIIAFIFLIICWFGVQYLPSAQNSVHTYAY